MKKIVFTGGGTAGHIYPNLAVAEKLPNWDKYYIGTHGMEEEILKTCQSIKFFAIDAVKFDRSKISKNFLIPFKLSSSIKQAKNILKKIKPNIIFSKGGYVSLPVVLAAKKLGITIVTHESDLTLGLANKIISLPAKKVCTTFLETCKNNSKYVFTGQPIREQILHGDKNKALLTLGYPTKPIIMFIGGSSGAKRINELLSDPEYLTKDFCVVHVTGKNNFKNFARKKDYFPFPFLSNVADYFAAADLVVTRAGSGVINELLAVKKPMLMLPLSKKASRGDQLDNAKLFCKYGYGEMILDEELNQNNLQENIEKMIKNLDFYKKNLQKAENDDAAQHIANLIEELC